MSNKCHKHYNPKYFSSLLKHKYFDEIYLFCNFFVSEIQLLHLGISCEGES